MKEILTYVAILLAGSATAQVTMSNFNVDVNVSSTTMTTTYLVVDGHIMNQAGGEWNNEGTIDLTGDWTNDGGNTALVNSSPGQVRLSGANQQIGGADVTLFSTLALQGTGIKSLAVDADVEDSLALTDRELATDIFDIYVMNSANTAVSRTGTMVGPFTIPTNEGMVSSVSGSRGLGWACIPAMPYTFPVGSSTGTARFRPVTLLASANDDIYINMINIDATIDGYDVSLTDSTICYVTDEYYHEVTGNTTVDLTFHTDDAVQAAFNTFAHWVSTEWQRASNTYLAFTSPILASHIVPIYTLNGTHQFAPAIETPDVDVVFTDTTICIGDMVGVAASPSDPSWTFSWNTGQNTDSFTDTPTANTTYVVTIDNGFCTDMDSLQLNVITPTPVNLGPDITITLGDCDTLNAGGSGSYIWTPATGLSCTTCANPEACPTVTTTYSVTLTDADGCLVSDDITITIEEDFDLWMPNVFSPNGDGENDQFMAYGRGIETIAIWIYDRWGELVYEGQDLLSGWDGTYNGDEMDSAVFIYRVEASFLNGETISDSGNFTLVR